MKFILYILITLMLSMLSFAQTQPRNAVRVESSYHNRSCIGGIGSCSNTETITESKNGNALLEKKSSKELVLYIAKKEVLESELQTLETEKIFEVSGEKNMILNKDLLLKLNFNTKLNLIKTGKYPVLITQDYLLVTFTLSDK